MYRPITLDEANLNSVITTSLPAQARNDDGKKIQPSVVGGFETDIESFPWVVAITINKGESALASLRCGGTLIDGDWVMTSAHCVMEGNNTVPSQDLRIVVGQADLTVTSGLSVEVKEIHPHPDFNEVTGDNDIALIRLVSWLEKAPVLISFSDAQPLANVGAAVTVVGWGSVAPSEDPEVYPNILRKAVLSLTDASQCQQALRNETGMDIVITGNMLCAGSSAQAEDACRGDSGGPLLYWQRDQATWDQIGIVSWGIGCSIANLPGVYTNLHPLQSWIRETMSLASAPAPEPIHSELPENMADPTNSQEPRDTEFATSYYFPFVPVTNVS